jgi:hypothetical protein
MLEMQNYHCNLPNNGSTTLESNATILFCLNFTKFEEKEKLICRVGDLICLFIAISQS